MKVLLIILISIALFSCKKAGHPYMASGTVTGQDLGMCPSCGGYFLKIDGNDTTYRFWNFPAGTSFDTTTHFPININFDYHRLNNGPFLLLQLDAVSLAK
jgi:hypothetical protein